MLASGAFDSVEKWVWDFLSSQQVRMVSTRCNVKKCLFLKLTCEVMEKEQDFIFGREKVQTVWNTQKFFFHF